ncbi:MAG TPA: hypothetical protein PKL76_21715 [Phycisphaerae bacterium]|nr:hypothetical protein [Phycisphaerae bacterium]
MKHLVRIVGRLFWWLNEHSCANCGRFMRPRGKWGACCSDKCHREWFPF